MKLVSFMGPRGPYEHAELTPEGITFRKGDSHMLFVPSPATILSLKDSKFGGLLRDCEEQSYVLGKGIIRANPSLVLPDSLWAGDEQVLHLVLKGWCNPESLEIMARPDELWAVKMLFPIQVTFDWRDLQFILRNPHLLRDEDDKGDFEDEE